MNTRADPRPARTWPHVWRHYDDPGLEHLAALWVLWWHAWRSGDLARAASVLADIERRDNEPSHLFILFWEASRARESELAARIRELMDRRASLEDYRAAEASGRRVRSKTP
jgi:hypothetical protein